MELTEVNKELDDVSKKGKILSLTIVEYILWDVINITNF